MATALGRAAMRQSLVLPIISYAPACDVSHRYQVRLSQSELCKVCSAHLISSWIVVAGALAASGVIGGLTMQVTLAQSLLHILASPVMLSYVVYAKLYSFQLHYTHLMWRLMRGNRYML